MELTLNKSFVIGGVVLIALLIGGAVGHAVTPADNPAEVLTPERWWTLQLGRRAQAEIGRLRADVQMLHNLTAKDRPDAIAAMTLAERIYAAQRTGTAATAPARQAVIAAAEAVARYAAGGATRAEAVAAVNQALEFVKALLNTDVRADADAPVNRRHLVHLPLVLGSRGRTFEQRSPTVAVRASATPNR